MQVQIADQQNLLRLDKKGIRRLITNILEEELSSQVGITISLVFVDDLKMKELNQRFLGRPNTTDVMAFPLSDDFDPDEEQLLGEVIVSVETAIREASKRKIPPEKELLLYLVHGCLHLLGYNDIKEKDRKVMCKKERQILRHYSLPQRHRGHGE